MITVNIRGKIFQFENVSANHLSELGKALLKLSEKMLEEQPSKQEALAAGIEDRGYNTVRHGYVSSYRGIAIIQKEDGRKFRCIGHEPEGDAEVIMRNGFIEFVEID